MISFVSLKESHLSIFRSWLNKDHIKPFWQEPENEEEFREKFLTKLSGRGVKSFIIEQIGIPIGYIQYYSAYKIGGGWWEDEKPGTYGIDLMIGDESKLGKGLGPKIICEFIKYLCSVEKDACAIIIDPQPDNVSAIRAFEKAGFKKQTEIKTPNGPALLMRMELSGEKAY